MLGQIGKKYLKNLNRIRENKTKRRLFANTSKKKK